MSPNNSPHDGHDKPEYSPKQALSAALSYAGRGVRVFPCRADKAPHTRRGLHDATTDRSRVHAFWSRWPSARVGLPTGERFWVLDVDHLAALGELPAELPATWTVRTPSGGLHYYFQPVEGLTNSTGGLPSGIDVRGLGGYVIAPPSPGYEVVDRTPMAEAPPWLVEMIRGPRKPDPQPLRRERAHHNSEPIPEGERNGTLFRVALDLKDRGRTAGEVLAGVEDANQRRCSLPLDTVEIARITTSAMRYPVRSGNSSPELREAVSELTRMWWDHRWKGLGAIRFS